MVEYKDRSPDNIFKDNPRLLDKLRNKALGNDSAWEEAQKLLPQATREPDLFPSYQGLIEEIFRLRRNAYVGSLQSKAASDEIQKKLASLPEEEVDLLTPLVVCIRDIFDISPQTIVRKKR